MSLKNLLVGLTVAVFTVVSFIAMADGKTAAKKSAPRNAGADQELTLTLTGSLTMTAEEVTVIGNVTDKVDKDGKDKEHEASKYMLVEADGTEIILPEPKGKGGGHAIDMESLVGKNVKVIAKCKVKTDAKGKKHVTVKSIVSVTEVVSPAAAPVAPAAPVTP